MLSLKKLCTPALIYFVLSTATLLMVIIQNMNSNGKMCIGSISCNVADLYKMYTIKFLFILVWTFMLNFICKSGAPIVSWFLVLFPFLVIAILLAVYSIEDIDELSANTN